VSWLDANQNQKFTRGRCLDLSASGIRIETPEAIPLRSYVSVYIESLTLKTSASVRHVVRSAGKYSIGLEFSCPLKNLAERLHAESEIASQNPQAAKPV